MGDGIKINKDKRHRSSSSLAGTTVEGTRSERKLDIRASIPEVDDQFATAEAMCDNLQEKIDLVKTLKRKRKLKKRSMTTVIDPIADHEHVPFITVRTQPKKKVSQAARLRAFQVPQNPIRGYLDPTTVDQRRKISQIRGYKNMQRRPRDMAPNLNAQKKGKREQKSQNCKVRPDGVGECSASAQISSAGPMEVACGRNSSEDSEADVFNSHTEDCPVHYRPGEPSHYKLAMSRRRHVPRDLPARELPKTTMDSAACSRGNPLAPPQPPGPRRRVKTAENGPRITEERPVVEIFSKNRQDIHRVPPPPIPDATKPNVGRVQSHGDTVSARLDSAINLDSKTKKENLGQPQRGKYRSRRYEMPTIASQMKQVGTRCYFGSAKNNLPFIVSKSTTPSHNIGVNLQQVLNGIKTQQPLTGIPMTIAYHMGMGHVPSFGARSTTTRPTLENREINSIKVGQRLLRLPSYKYMSYDRLLNLYRESDGIVSKYLRANSRPHYFYTSMYNLVNNREDLDGATSKGRSGTHEAKQSLAEYANIYKEFEQIVLALKNGNYDTELERRRDELSRELAAREEPIRKVVQEYRSSCDVDRWTLRASASTADDGYRHSTFKLNFGEPQ